VSSTEATLLNASWAGTANTCGGVDNASSEASAAALFNQIPAREGFAPDLSAGLRGKAGSSAKRATDRMRMALGVVIGTAQTDRPRPVARQSTAACE
jgi:hypothetical protein